MSASKAMFVAAVVLVAWATGAQAVKIGVDFGRTWAVQDFDCQEPFEYDTDIREGARFGLFVEHDVHPHLSVDAGVHYVTTGMYYDWMFYEAENRVNYISVPAVLRARLMSSEDVAAGENVSPYVFAGPRVDFLLDMEVDPWFESIYEDFARVGLGADVGGGFEIVHFRLEFRYSLTFTDARPDDPIYKITNRVQSVTIRVVIPPPENSSD